MLLFCSWWLKEYSVQVPRNFWSKGILARIKTTHRKLKKSKVDCSEKTLACHSTYFPAFLVIESDLYSKLRSGTEAV